MFTFLVAFDLSFLWAAISDLEIGAVPASLFIVITPETVVKVDMCDFLRAGTSGTSVDSQRCLADFLLSIVSAMFVISITGRVISVEPVGPLVT